MNEEVKSLYMTKRPEGMDFEEYRAIRKFNNKFISTMLRGRMFWNSSVQGTYKKEPTK